MIPPERVRRCYAVARDALLAERNEHGHWTGELSTSALSTATAVMALEMVRRAEVRSPGSGDRGQAAGPADHGPRTTDNQLTSLIAAGLRWLAHHQNADGGWGDTTKSLSNISTTMLARAVFRATDTEDEYRAVVDPAVQYIDRAGGVPAVVARYGKDRTFSIPILTHCALAGLVDWRDVKPLPFELACLPPRFYKTVRLPVVSYALPALIAIGQVRHHFRKPWNPATRAIRRLAIGPSLRRLEQIQPSNGGFLEATPLTSFVTMSLAGMGLADHPVARRGTEFIINSVRPDGSWPIDTNLATWVTTLAVNALGDDLPDEAREPILRWLLDQQYRTVHPYTNADPGGWAWTDLPGGVPDADDTPGAMLAIINLLGSQAFVPEDPRPGMTADDPVLAEGIANLRCGGELPVVLVQRAHRALQDAMQWLLDLQNRDGGWPTFCRGWGKLGFDRSAADITAHCIRAIDVMIMTGAASWDRAGGLVPPGHSLGVRAAGAGVSARSYLRNAQHADGAWIPLWFGNQHSAAETNRTYGTAKVLAWRRDVVAADQSDPEVPPDWYQRGLQWLLANQNPDGGWGGVRGTPSSVEETALATEILLSSDPYGDSPRRGVAWLLDRVEDNSFREPCPIGFYFAKLWYFERLYPLIFTTAALRRAARVYSGDAELDTSSSSHHETHETHEKGG